MRKTYILHFTDHVWNGREIDVDEYDLQGYEQEADAQRKLHKLFTQFKQKYDGDGIECDERSFTIFNEMSVTLDNIRCEIREVNVRPATRPYYVEVTYQKTIHNVEVIAESVDEAKKMAIQYVKDHHGDVVILEARVHNTFFD